MTMMLLGGLMCSLTGFAQQNKSIQGKLLDQAGQPINAATVALLKAKDSGLIKSDITTNDGVYEFTTGQTDSLLLCYTASGFEKTFSKPFVLQSNGTYNVPNVTLTPAVGKLKEVTVSAKKPMIEVKADKTVFNVEASINATGSDAFELLRKSPGVTVDNNDNISMKGKTGVRIYIDGKMSQLETKDLAAYLKSINSNDIEAIEMISNPSAKYDASGNAGIVNIRLKKNKKFGTNGSVTAGFVQGVTPKGNASVNLNYRDKKVNLFGNIGGYQGRNENTLELNRTQKDTIYDQSSINSNYNKNLNAKIGADFFLSSRSTLGVMATTNWSDFKFTSDSKTPIYYAPTGQFVKTLIATNSMPGKRTNANFNLNYRYADTSGFELNADADYGYFRGTGESYQPNRYYNGYNILYEVINRNNTPTDIDIYTGKIDMEKRIGQSKLGFGGKYSDVKTSNTFDFFNDNSNGVPVKILTRSNSFTYTEKVFAAYVNFQTQLNQKWSLQTGLRMENTRSEGDLTRADGIQQTDDNVKREYTNLFPSAALTYNINAKHSLNLTYSRRIDRPTYQDLNPFENKLDELTYEKGNAFLRPQYTHNVELTHTFMGFINTTMGYSHVKDYATQITDSTANATYVQQQNLATQKILSFSIGAPTPIKKWWSGYVNLWYNYQFFNGQIGGKEMDVKLPLYGAYVQQSFTLGKDYTAEISGWFNGPAIWGGTWRTSSQGAVDLGIQKQFWDKRASIRLAATDIFHTAPWTAKNDFGGIKINGGGTWESQTFRLNFTWRFGSNQIKTARERQTGLESESKRIKGGN
ncbi:MAG: hypothetical protein RLY16_1303 [Bacteroidota bacterium]